MLRISVNFDCHHDYNLGASELSSDHFVNVSPLTANIASDVDQADSFPTVEVIMRW
jgi:hypothetical protein